MSTRAILGGIAAGLAVAGLLGAFVAPMSQSGGLVGVGVIVFILLCFPERP